MFHGDKLSVYLPASTDMSGVHSTKNSQLVCCYPQLVIMISYSNYNPAADEVPAAENMVDDSKQAVACARVWRGGLD